MGWVCVYGVWHVLYDTVRTLMTKSVMHVLQLYRMREGVGTKLC